MDVYRTHNCNELSLKYVDKKVILSGWVHRIRDHGGVLFIDLRDHYGITQCVIENKNKFFFYLFPNFLIQLTQSQMDKLLHQKFLLL